jgi:hypothetical protein
MLTRMHHKLWHLNKLLAFSYGELKYTNTLQTQTQFSKVETFRTYDLDGKLVNSNVKYNKEELLKVLKTMIFVDEMDDILLKVKGQGMHDTYVRENLILYDIFWRAWLHCWICSST